MKPDNIIIKRGGIFSGIFPFILKKTLTNLLLLLLLLLSRLLFLLLLFLFLILLLFLLPPSSSFFFFFFFFFFLLLLLLFSGRNLLPLTHPLSPPLSLSLSLSFPGRMDADKTTSSLYRSNFLSCASSIPSSHATASSPSNRCCFSISTKTRFGLRTDTMTSTGSVASTNTLHFL
ncbi:unnamed protein product [Acanthosepion pharaonis]|uniref:Uncharacterized protein n=1 Tax=Acanthosepion pharaonis TaxID=158019 RepID=A0A812DCD5_ACAPH|nr:unnamed protein product [Sepia pharaonis]